MNVKRVAVASFPSALVNTPLSALSTATATLPLSSQHFFVLLVKSTHTLTHAHVNRKLSQCTESSAVVARPQQLEASELIQHHTRMLGHSSSCFHSSCYLQLPAASVCFSFTKQTHEWCEIILQHKQVKLHDHMGQRTLLLVSNTGICSFCSPHIFSAVK